VIGEPNANNQPDSLPSFGLLTVRITLELIGEHDGATAIARSALVEGKRTIRVGLYQEHLIVSKALARADALTVRFLIALSLVEFCAFWYAARDGASVRNELKRLSGFAAGDRAFGTAFASGLAISELMRAVDTLSIFGRSPQAEVLKPIPPRG
jgi:hypothetical protein